MCAKDRPGIGPLVVAVVRVERLNVIRRAHDPLNLALVHTGQEGIKRVTAVVGI